MIRFSPWLCAGLLFACALARADVPDAVPNPEDVSANPEGVPLARVVWGGIVTARNASGEIEVLAFPLGTDGKPDVERRSEGRFIAAGVTSVIEGLESGGLVTVTGRLQGLRAGRLGRFPYKYPLVRITRLHLWPAPDASGSADNAKETDEKPPAAGS